MEESRPKTTGLNNDEVLLQLHFHLWNKQTHSMDAVVYNDCERNFISAIKKAQEYFDLEFDIDVLAKEEGGVIGDYILRIRRSSTAKALLIAFSSAFFGYMFCLKPSKEKEILDKITIMDKIKIGNYTQEEFNYIAEGDLALEKLKSNFFKSASKEKKVKQQKKQKKK